MLNNYDYKYVLKKILIGVGIILVMSFIRSCEVHAEEYKYISVTPTSLHTYISVANVGNSSLVTFGNPTYREITANSSGYTWTLSESSSPRLITKLAFNVFGAFQVNKTYKVHWETNFPNDMNIEDYSCSMGSYTNNTAFPAYSNSSCTISRSDNGSIIMEGVIVIENGQYVTMIVTPKIGIDTTHVYDIANEKVPDLITKTFTLKYGSVKVMEMKSTNDSIDAAASQAHADSQAAASQAHTDSQNTQSAINSNTQAQQQTNSTLNDDNVDGANSQVDSLLQNDAFNDNSGINAIISLPLNFIQSLTSKSCRSLLVNIPYMNEVVSIPCMQNYIHTNAPTIYLIIKTFVNGFIIYKVLLDILGLVKSARNPDDDRIEVLDL